MTAKDLRAVLEFLTPDTEILIYPLGQEAPPCKVERSYQSANGAFVLVFRPAPVTEQMTLF